MTTTYFLNCIMGNVFNTKTTPVLPTTYYVGVSTTEPQADGTGVTEPSDTAYSRVLLDSLTEPDDGVITNDQDVEFNDSTTDWSTAANPLTHFVVYDAQTGGHLLFGEHLKKTKIVQSDSRLSFPAGELEFRLLNVVLD